MCQTASLVAQMVKHLPAMQETRVWSQGQEKPLEKGMATHSSILAWTIPWTEEPGGLRSMGSQRVGQTERLTLAFRHCSGFWVCSDTRNRQTSFTSSPTLRECLERKS